MKRIYIIILAIVAIAVLAGSLIYIYRQQLQPSPTQPATPSKLKVGAIYVTPLEQPFVLALHNVLVNLSKTYNYEYYYLERIPEGEVDRYITEYVLNEVNIIFTHTYGYWSKTVEVAPQYPNTIFVQTDSPLNITLPSNVIVQGPYLFEAAYVLGYMSGLLTQTNKIGVVAGFAVPSRNSGINGFIKGVYDANPNAEVRVIFIESWFDPVKAKETALALIREGFDVIFAERYGPELAAREILEREGKRIFIVTDSSYLLNEAPENIIGGTLYDLEPLVKWIIEGYSNKTIKGGMHLLAINGTPGNIHSVMKLGSVQKVYFNEELINRNIIPREVYSKVRDVIEKIIKGEIKVPFITADPRGTWGLK